MRSIAGLLVATVGGLALGVATAYVAIETEIGFNRLHVGPWVGSPRAGGVSADPYTRAALARSGELPVGGGEGVTFIGRTDSGGQPLSGRCSYVVAGDPPPARWWTLTAYALDGRLVENPVGRFGFTSREVHRDGEGRFSITVARSARPGDWLPLGSEGPFKLVVRLYDTPLATGASIVTPVLPHIRREACG